MPAEIIQCIAEELNKKVTNHILNTFPLRSLKSFHLKTCNRFARTCKAIHNAVTSLMHESLEFKLGVTNPLPNILGAVNSNSWHYVKSVKVYFDEKTWSAMENLSFDTLAFSNLWQIFVNFLSPTSQLVICWNVGKSFTRHSGDWLTDKVVAFLINIGHAFQSVQVALQKNAATRPIWLEFKQFRFSKQIQKLCQAFKSVTLEVADLESTEWTSTEALDLDLTSTFPLGGGKALVLHSSTHFEAHYLPGTVNIKFLHLSDLSATTLPIFQNCLMALKTTLEILHLPNVILSKADLEDIECSELTRLRMIIITDMHLIDIPWLISLLTNPDLETLKFRNCLKFGDSPQQLDKYLTMIRIVLPDDKVEILFSTTYKCSLGNNWLQSCAELVALQEVVDKHNAFACNKLHFSTFRPSEDFYTQFPRAKMHPVDDCTLDEILPVDIRHLVRQLNLKLTDKPFKPTRCQSEVSLPHLVDMTLTIFSGSSGSHMLHTVAKLDYLLHGLCVSALRYLQIHLEGHPSVLTVERHMLQIALFLPMCPSLDEIKITAGRYLSHEACFDLLKSTARDAGVSYSLAFE